MDYSGSKSKFNIKYINANRGEIYHRLRDFYSILIFLRTKWTKRTNGPNGPIGPIVTYDQNATYDQHVTYDPHVTYNLRRLSHIPLPPSTWCRCGQTCFTIPPKHVHSLQTYTAVDVRQLRRDGQSVN